MASAQTLDEELVVRCGSCGEVEGYLLTPKRLPCQHLFCVACLEGHQTDEQLIKCFTCEVEYSGSIADLPPALEKPDCYCDPCKKKGVMTKTAKVFCTKCEHKYCAKHEEAHDDLNEGHRMISIKAYRESSLSEEVRYCENHKSEPVTIGCKICWIVLCPLCISTSKHCPSGGSHDLMALIELEKEFTQYLEPLKQRVEDRFDEFSAIVKQTTLSLSQWDTETEQSVSTLHNAREEQLREITAKYAALEDEYRRSRGQGKDKLSDYKEKAGTKLAELHDCLKSMRTDISNKHVIDSLKNRERFIGQMNLFLNEEFPGLTITDQRMFERSGKEIRCIEMEIKPADDIIISPAAGNSNHQQDRLPTGIEFWKQVALAQPCRVCHYKDNTYVCTQRMVVERIGKDGKFTNSFIKLNGYPCGIIAHKDRLYILTKGKPHKVHGYSLQGQMIVSWAHGDYFAGDPLCRTLTIIDDELVIVDRTNKKFTIYSLNGDLLRSVRYDGIEKRKMSLCHAGGDSIIVTNCDAFHGLLKFNLVSGAVEWTSNAVKQPSVVMMLNKKYALATEIENSAMEQVFIVYNLMTGELVLELTDHLFRDPESAIYDICIDGDTVIIPKANEGVVLYYKLKYD